MSNLETDVLAILLAACDAFADLPAITDHRGRTTTYHQFGDQILRTAGGLREAGFGPGERMLFSVRPDPSGIVLALGAVAAGGSVIFMDPGVGAELFAARVEVANAGWAAAESLLYAASAPGPLRFLARRRGLLLPRYSSLPVRHIRSGYWLPGVPIASISTARLARGPVMARPRADPGQPAVTVFTSGTTSAPRAVVHSRGSLGAALTAMSGSYSIGPASSVLTDQLMLGLPALAAGSHWRLPPFGFSPRVDPAEFAGLLAGVTHTFLVPADLAAVLTEVESGRVAVPAELRQILIGAAPVLPNLIRRMAAVLPDVEPLAIYGMTEILPVAVATRADKLDHKGAGDSLGTLIPGVTARIADDGELLVSGPNSCLGYLTAAGLQRVTEFDTGDLAMLDGAKLVLLGRKKDMIIRRDKNIYPGLYEPAIAALPGVGAAVMIGIADDIGDERVVVLVTPDTENEILSAAAILPGHLLAERVRAALPNLIDAGAQPDAVLVVSSIPTSGRTRKPDRAELRRLVAGESL